MNGNTRQIYSFMAQTGTLLHSIGQRSIKKLGASLETYYDLQQDMRFSKLLAGKQSQLERANRQIEELRINMQGTYLEEVERFRTKLFDLLKLAKEKRVDKSDLLGMMERVEKLPMWQNLELQVLQKQADLTKQRAEMLDSVMNWVEQAMGTEVDTPQQVVDYLNNIMRVNYGSGDLKKMYAFLTEQFGRPVKSMEDIMQLQAGGATQDLSVYRETMPDQFSRFKAADTYAELLDQMRQIGKTTAKDLSYARDLTRQAQLETRRSDESKAYEFQKQAEQISQLHHAIQLQERNFRAKESEWAHELQKSATEGKISEDTKRKIGSLREEAKDLDRENERLRSELKNVSTRIPADLKKYKDFTENVHTMLGPLLVTDAREAAAMQVKDAFSHFDDMKKHADDIAMIETEPIYERPIARFLETALAQASSNYTRGLQNRATAIQKKFGPFPGMKEEVEQAIQQGNIYYRQQQKKARGRVDEMTRAGYVDRD